MPSAGPEAELWMGAHPGAPAAWIAAGLRVSLVTWSRDDPRAVLGQRVSERFGSRLPFLLKVLAADAAAVACRPTRTPSRRRPASRRGGAGVPQGERNYTDPHHKPELLVALTPFEALCGFRDPAESAEALAAFGVPALAPVVAALRAGPAAAADGGRTLLALAGRAERRRAAGRGAWRRRPTARTPTLAAAGWPRRYPGDPGVAGRAAAATTSGWRRARRSGCRPATCTPTCAAAGVEIMAASDNVLRGGLTPKRVDVDELLRVLRFEVLDDPVRAAQPVGPGVDWLAGAGGRLRAAPGARRRGGAVVTLPLPGPRVVLCAGGSITVDDGAGALTLASGRGGVRHGAGAPLRIERRRCGVRGDVRAALTAARATTQVRLSRNSLTSPCLSVTL